MKLLSTYKPYYKANLQLAFPVILSQIGQITVQLADTAMVGYYGGEDPTPLAAVSFATSIFYIVFVAAMGLSFGLTPLVGEHFARDEKRQVSELLQNGVVLFSVIGFLSVGLLVAIRPLLGMLGDIMTGGDGSTASVVEQALPYFDSIVWSMLPIMVVCTVKQFLEGVGNTRIAMVTVIIANAVNILLNWVFIFGKCGLEPMGAVGAGYATLIARILQAVILTGYFLLTPRFREYTSELFSRSVVRLRTIYNILKVGTPIAFQMLMEASAFVVAGILVLAFGAHAVSAYQIGTNMMNVTFMIVVAIGSATTILCSHIYGRRDFSTLRRTVNAAYMMGLAWNVTVAVLFIIFRYDIPRLFTSNEPTIELTATMLIFIALFQVSDCLQAISISILRGLQDVKVIMPIVIISYVVFNIPVGYFLAFDCGFGAVGLIMGFIVGLSTCALLTILRVRRDVRRLEARE
ncbi:MAG: MATE family efflux transporter [Rikenellaceae bacterium]|nr:MATE family efflux transporter [Rikenellaceae bacterium]